VLGVLCPLCPVWSCVLHVSLSSMLEPWCWASGVFLQDMCGLHLNTSSAGHFGLHLVLQCYMECLSH
jgi:hypothetical protein